MMDLYDRLLALGFTDSDFRLQDDSDGNGPYIREWFTGHPQPSQEELEAVFVVPELPQLSRRQFGQGMWLDGLISYQEFIDFLGGTIPPLVVDLLAILPDTADASVSPRKLATGLMLGARDYDFKNPLVEGIRRFLAIRDDRWTLPYLVGRWQVWAAY